MPLALKKPAERNNAHFGFCKFLDPSGVGSSLPHIKVSSFTRGPKNINWPTARTHWVEWVCFATGESARLLTVNLKESQAYRRWRRLPVQTGSHAKSPIVQRSGNRCRWWLIRHGGFARLGRLGGYARLLWITRNAGGAPAIVVGVRGIAVRLSVHIVLHCIRPRLRASAVEVRAGYFYPTFRRPKHLPRCVTTSGRQEPGTRRTDRRHPALRCEC